MENNDFTDFVNDSMRIIEEGQRQGIIFRLMGACAIRIHCPKHGYLYDDMKRSLTDIDLVTYGKFNSKLEDFFTGLGLIPNENIIRYYGHKRHIYYDEKKRRTIDIFIDKLEMCHTVNFVGRLELDYPTIALTDILLQKMQIVEINEKDIKDTIIMLLEHDVGDTDKESINMKYLANLLSQDWGFFHTVNINLAKVKDTLPKYEALKKEDQENVLTKVSRMQSVLEKEPKSSGWKMRAKIGTRKKWYTEVDEVTRRGLHSS